MDWTGLGCAHFPSARCQVFTLPKVSAKTKFKLTAHEGCRVRKVALATFASVACEDYAETCLACLTNLGDLHVFSVPGLRPQVHYSCIRKEDISGIASCVFTRHGQGEAKAFWDPSGSRSVPERSAEGVSSVGTALAGVRAESSCGAEARAIS